MKLTNQAAGALMMALQKCLLEETDIMPLLQEMNFQVAPDDQSQSTLVVTNPPVVSFENVEVETDADEETTTSAEETLLEVD